MKLEIAQSQMAVVADPSPEHLQFPLGAELLLTLALAVALPVAAAAALAQILFCAGASWCSSGTNIFCKGSVDTTILGVDTMVQNKGRNVKKSPSQVDTNPKQVDTRDLSQGFILPVWESVSTHLMGRSTHSRISVT
ncbi:hypothetical protein Taro_020018 [Colocasia esculenta]|uniref:Uncharacterized protein n=1 Tax=Colocasia esculenta TaxID=4460 RepID=A0A843UYE3_COLES|nr:hypothetical protein [Colocasia esculenta]